MAERELTSILRDTQSTSSKSANELTKGLGLDQKAALEIEAISRKPKINILSDQPARQDALGMDAIVSTLANIILSESTQTPITIGLDGKWGTGKTSILRMIEAQARLLDFPCIWLNAWSLESTENLIAAVASEVQRESHSREPSKEKLLLENILNLLTTAAGSVIGSSSVLKEVVESIRRTGGLVRASREREQEIAELASVITTRLSFERLVNLLLASSEYKKARLIIFIDDIDRALPDQIATILRNLKLILEIPQCVFVLAMDMNIVATAIENYYRRNQSISLINASDLTDSTISINTLQSDNVLGENFGHNYLEKLIQLRVMVPGLTRDLVNTFLKSLTINPKVLEIVRWAPDDEVTNPRRLKRYINWLSVSLQLIRSLPLPSEIQSHNALRAMALQRDYPEIYELLKKGDKFNTKVDRPLTKDKLEDPKWASGLEPEIYNSLLFLQILTKKRKLSPFEFEDEADRFLKYLGSIPKQQIIAFDEFAKITPILHVSA